MTRISVISPETGWLFGNDGFARKTLCAVALVRIHLLPRDRAQIDAKTVFPLNLNSGLDTGHRYKDGVSTAQKHKVPRLALRAELASAGCYGGNVPQTEVRTSAHYRATSVTTACGGGGRTRGRGYRSCVETW